MKTLVFSLIGSLSAFAASNECRQEEAQIVGTVTSVIDLGNACQVKASFAQYNMSSVCPLLLEEAANGFFVSKGANGCGFSAGDAISGVLVKSDGSIRLED